MGRAEILFDISRLVTRFSRLVPNGIDRVDLGYADHFLSREGKGMGVLLGPLGPRATSRQAARSVVDAVAGHWRESEPPEADEVFAQLKRTLLGCGVRADLPDARKDDRKRPWRSLGALLAGGKILGRGGLLPGCKLEKAASEGAVYLNVSQFPIWIEAYLRWLRRRPDVKPVFFIHDLLPIEFPEFFRTAEAARHAARLEVTARYARGLIVASEEIRVQLASHLRALGRPMPPCCVLPIPVAAPFLDASEADPDLAEQTYFVAVGTLEPRKNHLLLLQIWRELAQTASSVPKLILVGARGWDHENVSDMLDRCAALRDSVIVTGQLSTPALRRLLAGTRALLMPSFAEGYGLPVAEALAAGVPVIATDIPSCRTCPDAGLTRLDATDGLGWMAAIRDHATSGEHPVQRPPDSGSFHPQSWAWHFEHVNAFLTSL